MRENSGTLLKFIDLGFRFACNSADAVGLRETVFVKDHEALKARAVVRELAQAVEHEVNDLLAWVG